MIREKRTVAGKLFQSDIYPCWSDGRRIPSRAPKTKKSTPEQEKYNKNKAAIEFIRLVSENFNNTDHVMCLTYTPIFAPENEKEARKDVTNFFRCFKRFRQKELEKVTKALEALPNDDALAEQRKNLEQKKKKLSAPFKYAYVIGKATYQRGPHKGKTNYHFHLFMTGGIDRDIVEEMWPNGMRCNADRFQPERFGPEAMARYMINQAQGLKKFVTSRNCSRNYRNPKIKNKKLTAVGVERIAKQRVDDAQYWEKRYPGYRFVKCFPRHNEYNGHWYISVLMWKKDGGEPPKWNFDSWADDF